MNKITITAKSEAGTKALKQHLEESLKLRRDQKLMFKMLGYSQEKVNDDPLQVAIIIKNKRLQHILNPLHFTQTLKDGLAAAKEGTDYTIEVE